MNTMRITKGLAALVAVGICFMAAQTQAVTTFQITAGTLYDQSGITPAPQPTLGLLVIDTGNNGLTLSNVAAGASLSNGATFGSADDIIVARFDLTALATDGFLQTVQNVTYGGSITLGKFVALVWFPGETILSTAALGGQFYGIHEDPTGLQAATADGSVAWVLPTDAGLSLNLNFFNPSSGQPNGFEEIDGKATGQVVPEPSSIMLVVLGMLGSIGMIRRRRS